MELLVICIPLSFLLSIFLISLFGQVGLGEAGLVIGVLLGFLIPITFVINRISIEIKKIIEKNDEITASKSNES